MTELFNVLNPSKPDFWVEVLHDTGEAILVEHEGEHYELKWVPQYSYYRGVINGLEGYIL